MAAVVLPTSLVAKHRLHCIANVNFLQSLICTLILLSSTIPHFEMPATTAETLAFVSRQVSVAPLVLLSAADHYGRVATKNRRVVGVLLGQNEGKGVVRVSNSFASESILQQAIRVI